MSAAGDDEGGVGVPEVVEAERRESRASDRGPEDAGHEGVLAPDANRPGSDESELAGDAGEQLLADDAAS